ncbi:MAG: redox-sensitive transcriptional activator SoxR [Candidatus Dormibacteria bacterium]|jgi:MerR family redox-sensitive transcriptional activator SoxR
MPVLPPRLSIGELSRRSGLAPSAIRFYESRGLLASDRSAGGQRQFVRAALRRLAFISAAQQVGLTLEEIRAALASLPDGRTPTRQDWQVLSAAWRSHLELRIAALERLRDDLSGCVGCGCLSLRRCRLYNTGDAAAAEGQGSRLVRAFGTTNHLTG